MKEAADFKMPILILVQVFHQEWARLGLLVFGYEMHTYMMISAPQLAL